MTLIHSFEHLEMLPHPLYRCPRGIDEIARTGAPGQCFNPEGATSGKEVEAARSIEMGSQPIEKRFPDSITRWAQSFRRVKGELAPAPAAAERGRRGRQPAMMIGRTA